MGYINWLSNNFSSGQVSALGIYRQDQPRVRSGLKECTNFRPMPLGPLTRREGTLFTAPQWDETYPSILVPFQYSNTASQSYYLNIGHQYTTFFKPNGTQVRETAKNITGITKANPAVVTSNSHGYSNADQVYISGVAGMTQVNGRWFKVANAAANTFELQGVDSSNYSTYTSGGTAERVYKVTTPWTYSQLSGLRWRQSADRIYFTHQSYAERTLTRTADTSWTLATTSFTGGPFMRENTTATTLDPSGTSGSVTVLASSTTGINNGSGFASTDVGRLIRFHDGTDYHILQVTAWTSTTQVTATVLGAGMAGHTASALWSLGSFSDTSGYPLVSVFHQDRAVYANTPAEPDTFFFSQVSLYDDMAAGTADGEPFKRTLNQSSVNGIQWLWSSDKLFFGTTAQTGYLSSSSSSDDIQPTTARTNWEDTVGAASTAALATAGYILFPDRSQTSLRGLRYFLDKDSYVALNLNILTPELCLGGISGLALAQSPRNEIYTIRADGVLLSATIVEEPTTIVGWAVHELGGTGTVVNSVTTLPTTGYDEICVAVSRTINGSTHRYIERFSQPFLGVDLEDAVFTDCSYQYSGTAVSSLSNLWHLEGQTVGVLVNGYQHPDCTVSSGTITLNTDDCTAASVGLKYTSTAELLDIAEGSQYGGVIGLPATVNRVFLAVYETVLSDVINSRGTTIDVNYRRVTDTPGEAIPLFTGIKEVVMGDTWDLGAGMSIVKDDILPCTVLAVNQIAEVSDRR